LKKLCGIAAVLCLAAVSMFSLASCGSGSSAEQGGTLHGIYASFPDALDPTLSYSQEGWTAMYETYIPLLTYARANGSAGGKVIPGLAKSLPKVSDGGKTYTLVLRKGLKYSDGTPVRASDFKFAAERMFKVNSPGSPFYTTIVGAEAFAEKKAKEISGIETDDESGKIVIHLTSPRGTFNNELGMPFTAPLPPDTPDEDMTANPPPATGPYAIVKSRPGQGWEYERNPQWAKTNAKAMPEFSAGHFDKIKIDIIENASTAVNDVEQGRYDWMQQPPPPDRYAAVKSKFEGTQFRLEPGVSTYYFWMNTTHAPFDDLKVRQAVNYALDGEALERIYAGQLTAGQQILPPGMPGYEKFELYPHNMAKAKELIKEANPADRDITVWSNVEPENKEATEYYADVLRKLGFNVKLKQINSETYFTLTGNRSTPDLDTGWSDWFEDYPHPNDFFGPLLSAESIQDAGNTNLAEIDIPEFNEKIAGLAEQDLGPKQEAEYAALDKGYMEQAPWAPYGSRTVSTFVSSEIDLDKVVFNPTFGQSLASFQRK
jgi:peptide/nickel transport system substrate-binding protein